MNHEPHPDPTGLPPPTAAGFSFGSFLRRREAARHRAGPQPPVDPTGEPADIPPQGLVRGSGIHRATGQRGHRRARSARHRRPVRLPWGRLGRVVVLVLGAAALAVVVAVLRAGPASAATGAPLGAGGMLAVNSLPTVVNNATKWLVGILATLATFFLTLGGAKYLMAGGDPSEVERAKGSFRNAAIGYGLAVLAPVLLKILQGILGVT